MATAKKDAAKATDSQEQMTSFVQTFARPSAPAPTAPPAVAAEPTGEVATDLEELTEAPEAAQPTATAEQQAQRQSTSGKKKAAPTIDEDASWAENFLQPVRNRKTKAIYVDEETHATLAHLTQEGGVGLADLLINITNNHFDTYKAEIREFLAERERLKKKKSRF